MMAPEFLPIVQDIPRDDLEATVRTLMELTADVGQSASIALKRPDQDVAEDDERADDHQDRLAAIAVPQRVPAEQIKREDREHGDSGCRMGDGRDKGQSLRQHRRELARHRHCRPK